MSKSNDAFRTISEVAKELGLATHVLRFWESKFPQIKPLKRAGGRRYYRPDDVALLRRLQSLLHDEGYTIKGVQRLLREEGPRKLINEGEPATDQNIQADIPPVEIKQVDEQPCAQQSTPVASPNIVQQPNLFDAAEQPTEIETQSLETNFDQNNEQEITDAPNNAGDTSYFQPLVPGDYLDDDGAPPPFDKLPEPEPVYAPDAAPPQVIVKRALSETQRQKLEDVLSELKAMKSQIDNVA